MKRHNNGYWIGRDGKYNVRIYEDGKRRYLGAYDTEESALEAYSKACNEKLIRSLENYGHCVEDGVLYKDNYIVFDNGDIFSITGYKLKCTVTKYGYVVCRINNDHVFLHRIIACCFIPNPMNKPHVNHINGIKTDNRVENLEWCTYAENNKHAYSTGLNKGPRGEFNGRSRLTLHDIQYIRDNYIPGDKNYGMRGLARKFNVHRNTIYNIIHGEAWRQYDE